MPHRPRASRLAAGHGGLASLAYKGLLTPGIDLQKNCGQSGLMNQHTPTPLHNPQKPREQVTFQRPELNAIMGLYGRMVAAGEWRDYGVSFLTDVAIFAIFRHTSQNPIYRIEKRPKLRLRQGQYAVIAMDGQVLKRGQDLKTVLRVLERKLIRSVP